MPQIGTFTREPSGFTGRIHTFTLYREITVVPAEPSDAENAPDYRIHHGNGDGPEIGPEIGAGWKRTGERAGEYIALAGPGVRRGRGASFVQSRHIAGGWRHSTPGVRRVVIKTRFVKGAGKSGKAAAHLRYIQRDGTGRPSDRAIAGIAEDGIYRPSRHLEQARFEDRVPGGDYEGFVDAHVRRLEALRRAGITERIDANQWRIPTDFEARAVAHDAGRSARANIRVLSTLDLERQIGSDGATWLDRRLVGASASDLSASGFGEQVREAIDRRRETLIDRGDAIRQSDGRTAYRRNLIATLQDREIARVGDELAVKKALPFRAAADGETVTGQFTGTVQLSSGKFAIVEKSHEFTLVPWRPVIDRQLGREVSGIMQGGSVSWQLGRYRGLGI